MFIGILVRGGREVESSENGSYRTTDASRERSSSFPFALHTQEDINNPLGARSGDSAHSFIRQQHSGRRCDDLSDATLQQRVSEWMCEQAEHTCELAQREILHTQTMKRDEHTRAVLGICSSAIHEEIARKAEALRMEGKKAAAMRVLRNGKQRAQSIDVVSCGRLPLQLERGSGKQGIAAGCRCGLRACRCGNRITADHVPDTSHPGRCGSDRIRACSTVVQNLLRDGGTREGEHGGAGGEDDEARRRGMEWEKLLSCFTKVRLPRSQRVCNCLH